MAAAGSGDETGAASMPLSLAMRRHTRKIHRSSDALVNLKLALAFSDPVLYARAIALFHPVYERIEALLPQAAQKEPALRPLAELLLSGPNAVARAKAFEADLSFFLGPEWRATLAQSSSPRPQALEAYLARLEEVPPELLAAYAFHMYMALLSGGQILRRLTRAALGLDKGPTAGAEGGDGGTAVYEFPAPAAELKERLRGIVDGMEAQVLARRRGGGGGGEGAEAAKLRAALLEESMRVFLQNNALAGTFDTGRRGKQVALLLVLLVLLALGLLASAGVYLIRAVMFGGVKG